MKVHGATVWPYCTATAPSSTLLYCAPSIISATFTNQHGCVSFCTHLILTNQQVLSLKKAAPTWNEVRLRSCQFCSIITSLPDGTGLTCTADWFIDGRRLTSVKLDPDIPSAVGNNGWPTTRQAKHLSTHYNTSQLRLIHNKLSVTYDILFLLASFNLPA